MAVCKYWMNGQCRFGDRCRHEHPQSGSSGTKGTVTAAELELLRKDLTVEKPSWPLSSFGPRKDEPCVVAGIDMCFEEMRWMWTMENRATGQCRQYYFEKG
ncbi:hypothetical protein BJ684DRAFT_21121 [Piptocephalis cylindrospora]|uniref:C3H1-type domain-containing protein n=1 Tax=Piptocephalis cylindrospora TaxID=1907219 RepID=A0A4P9Y0Q7_9FUNG|nr:hypothetical protein BJ684DRAFT_21121 [Piptocephalis cylindrospora]|eukprot:RKP12328.1 hypothetical protein BJ684DRAFT_21121 [Piptocephalis cylindrospora]